ncbi:hypothetical protein CEXT_440011 [Caerostris extrusa]|uniref:Uncharacterized protein n=1 Tax=Caerostris extrusa TaxID=172846 RepID=A0AAV4SCU0_CAEEX|nr:hypothetical protein CEXT_440011 [Caerostris extrusa]
MEENGIHCLHNFEQLPFIKIFLCTESKEKSAFISVSTTKMTFKVLSEMNLSRMVRVSCKGAGRPTARPESKIAGYPSSPLRKQVMMRHTCVLGRVLWLLERKCHASDVSSRIFRAL